MESTIKAMSSAYEDFAAAPASVALHAVNSLAADIRLGPGGAAVSSPSSSPSAVTSQAEKADCVMLLSDESDACVGCR
ncbi:hypothetical protein OPV22_021257 [Ensete ventricosum]|uniref:Uncharacterized protein n=1 Tax=Ensete ventricosum TaxID=4639 RepID=A0AAV8PAX4_ENSVE|nr:hypothetical protein OPV22_021257 [Ensete ventricosum]